MRFLAIGPRAYLGDIYLSLMREGHEVRVHAEDPPEERAFGGLIECDAWVTISARWCKPISAFPTT